LTLNAPLRGEDQIYMRLKIALSRILPYWDSILLDNNGSLLVLTFETDILTIEARDLLMSTVTLERSVLYKLLTSRLTPWGLLYGTIFSEQNNSP
jgi:hypothetical protein